MFRSSTPVAMPINQWLSLSKFQQTMPQTDQLMWLSEHGSMTQLLQTKAQKSLKIDVLTAAHNMVHRDERLFLNILQRQWSYVREVIMNIDDLPWMFGRTVIPSSTLTAGGGKLKLLGTRPLGKLLFNKKGNSRQFIEVAKISKTHYLFPDNQVSENIEYLWARRSLFSHQRQPILVQEIFLPDCPFPMPQ